MAEHRIDTGESKPNRQQLRQFAPSHVEAISEHVDSMIVQRVVELASIT